MQSVIIVELFHSINRLVQFEHFLRETDNVNVRSAAEAMKSIGINFCRGSTLVMKRAKCHTTTGYFKTISLRYRSHINSRFYLLEYRQFWK